MNKILVSLISAFLLYSVAMASPSSLSNRPNLRAVSIASNSFASLNWAGYAMHTGIYSSASGNWIVPSISNATSGYSSAWIGIGGFSGNTVIQIGTEQDCLSGTVTGERYHGPENIVTDNQLNRGSINSGKNGGGKTTNCKPSYYAWWELYPQNAEQKITGMSIAPGDSVSASVAQNANSTSWTLIIKDNTSGQSFATTQIPNFVPDQASAEMIAERPSLCNRFSCTLTNLANFGTIGFSGVSANGAQFSSTNSDSITMIDSSSRVLAQPSPISVPGIFSVKWFRSS